MLKEGDTKDWISTVAMGGSLKGAPGNMQPLEVRECNFAVITKEKQCTGVTQFRGVVTAEGVLRAREVRRMEQEHRCDEESINNVIGVPSRNVDGRWTVQRERITRTDIEAFGTTAGCLGCNAIRSAQAHSDLCRVRIEECRKTTPEGSERLDRRREVLNEAIAKEVDRNVRRRKETRSTAEDLAAPQELKNVPIPPDSDPRKRRAMKAAIAVASSGSPQMDSNTAVANESRMDVEGEERDESRGSTVQNRRRIMTKTSMEESQMDDEGKERDESRSSTEPNTRGNDHPRVVRWDGHEGLQALMIWRQAAAQVDGSVQGEQRTTGPRKPMSL